MLQRLRRLVARVRARAVRRRGLAQRIAFAAAALLVVGLYVTNHDNNHDDPHPRGDGVYRPVLARGDGHMMYLMARSTALDGDWDFANDLGRFGDPWHQLDNPDTHRKMIPHPIGPPLIWTPLIWIAELGAVVANVFGADIALHGYTAWHQRFVFLTCVLAGIAAVWIGRNVARRAMGARWSGTVGAIAILLGSSLTYYVTFMPSYGHAYDAFFCACFLGYWARTLGRHDRKRWLVLGALLGAAMLIRVQEAGMAIVLVVEGLVAFARAFRAKRLRAELVTWAIAAPLVIGAMLLVFAPQLIYWKRNFGAFFAWPQGAKYTRLGSPFILELLYSPRNGWFSSTPIAYLAMIGLVCAPKRSRLVAGGFLAAVALQVYLNSTIFDWWGMAAFGQRRLCSVTVAVVFGLASLLWRMSRVARRIRLPRAGAFAIAGVVLGAFVAWNFNRLWFLRAGAPAGSELEPNCCDRVPPALRGPARWVYDRIGDPFEFPANLIYGLRHDVPIQRWDQAAGNYPLIPGANSLFDGTLAQQHGSWHIGSPGTEPYLIDAFSDSHVVAGRPARWTRTDPARVLVPNLMPEPERLTVWLRAGATRTATLRWDGEIVVANAALAPNTWTPVVFELHPARGGDHELQIEAALGDVPPELDPKLQDRRAGVAISAVDIHLLDR